MSEVNQPKQNEILDAPMPNPGGDIDTGGSAVPPYEGRTTGAEQDSREKGPEPYRHEDEGSEGDPADRTPPDGVGESIGTRGEDAAKSGTEPGRFDTEENEGGSDRPAGSSTARDVTSVDPQEGNAEDR